ncbi:MAG: glycosyltransferase family 2 protein [Breznakibacter sp.]
MTKPTVSIVTIVYNGQVTIEKTIQSIAAQTYPNIEYIVVDGASSDGTMEIVKRYPSVVNKWISEPDKGLYDAMNKGIDLASGDYLWFINSGDEIYAPDTLQRLFSADRPLADVYYGDTVMIDALGGEIGQRRLTPPKNLTWQHFRYGMRVSHQSFICKRHAAGYYNISYKFSADYEWCLLALKSAKSIENSHLILSRFLDGGLTKQNIVPGLKERFAIMWQHFGLIPTLWQHVVLGVNLGWFIIRNRRF